MLRVALKTHDANAVRKCEGAQLRQRVLCVLRLQMVLEYQAKISIAPFARRDSSRLRITKGPKMNILNARRSQGLRQGGFGKTLSTGQRQFTNVDKNSDAIGAERADERVQRGALIANCEDR